MNELWIEANVTSLQGDHLVRQPSDMISRTGTAASSIIVVHYSCQWPPGSSQRVLVRAFGFSHFHAPFPILRCRVAIHWLHAVTIFKRIDGTRVGTSRQHIAPFGLVHPAHRLLATWPDRTPSWPVPATRLAPKSSRPAG